MVKIILDFNGIFIYFIELMRVHDNKIWMLVFI